MNKILRTILWSALVSGGILLFFSVVPAWAGDGTREWRPIYDVIMRWINFGILAYFLVKVVGPILVNFLSDQQADIRSKIEKTQKEKDDIIAKLKEAKESLENSGPRLEEIRSRIVEQGEIRKREIIEDANEQSRLMMKNARLRIDNMIGQARQKLVVELLDMAMEKAVERLPGEITEEDNQRLVEKYLNAAAVK